MKTITVNASKKYDIIIGTDLLPGIGEKIIQLGKVQKVCIVSDSNVFPLYGKVVADSLVSAGLSVSSFVFSAGEESKNAEN